MIGHSLEIPQKTFCQPKSPVAIHQLLKKPLRADSRIDAVSRILQVYSSTLIDGDQIEGRLCDHDLYNQ